MNSMTTLVTARIATCPATPRAGSMNCGSSAVKNTSALGLATCSRKPSASMRAPPRSGAAPTGTESVGERPKNALTPSQTR